MDTRAAILFFQETLQRAQRKSGAWGYRGNQASVETTCLAILAIRRHGAFETSRAVRLLEDLQNPNGSWPGFAGDDKDGCWATALAAFTLMAARSDKKHLMPAIDWLLKARGREANWLWR
ncbi:MAG TPA: hypothetical protein VN673_09005, partial [Clostridia bacterium]|nr:hypothetical protein [Clostridia bacterium]